MILREILETLQRIEEKMGAGGSGLAPAESTDEWIQKGLDSIMSFQAGKKKEDGE